MKGYLLNIKKHLLDLLLLASLIIISDDSFLFGTSNIASVNVIKYSFIIAMSILFFLRYKLHRGQVILFMICVGLIFLSALLSLSFFSGGLLILTCTLLIAITTTNKYTLSGFGFNFSELVFIINLYSIVIWLLLTLHFIEPNSIRNSIGVIVQNFAGCNFFSGSIPGFYRSASFFREPGMYMIFICISYIFEIFFLSRKVGFFRLIVYVISLLSTFSTAGFIVFGLIYILNLCKKNNHFSLRELVIPIILLLGVILFINANGIGEFVFGKFERGEDSVSYLGRISSISIPLDMIIQSPIWGCGIADFKDIYISTGLKLYHIYINPDGLSTNTILNIGAIFGIPLCIIMIYGLYKFSQKAKCSRISKLFVFIAILMLFSNEAAVYSLPFYWLVFYGYSSTPRISHKQQHIQYLTYN